MNNNANQPSPAPSSAAPSKKRVKFTGTGDDDDEEIIMDDEPAPSNTEALSRPMRRSAAQSLKKMKIDEDQQVKEILERTQAHYMKTIDISVKKYIFKLIKDCTNESQKSKVAINQVWQKYFNLDDEQQKNPTTNKHYFQSK